MSLTGNATSGYILRGKISKLDTLRGYSAYEVACINGFKGTKEEWLASLKGEPFVYEDFTKEQLAALKGEPFKYEDFTPEQLNGLAGAVTTFNGRKGAVVPRSGDYTAAMVGAAPAGYGYGGTIADGGEFADDAAFLEWLAPIYAAMPDKSTKQIQFVPRYGSVADVRWIGTIYKNVGSYGSVFAYGYKGQNSTNPHMIARALVAGVWNPFEWVNPPLEFEEEYRTTERYLDKSVYVQIFDLGAFPNAGEITEENLYSCKYVVSAELYAVHTPTKKGGPISASSNKDLVKMTASTGGTITITTTGNMSVFGAYVVVKYAKEG